MASPSSPGNPSPDMLSPTAAAKALGINLGSTIGALLLGGLVSAALYGITSTQTVVYYQREHRDPWYVKAIVFALWLLDSFDMFLVCHILYWYLINNYGNLLSLSDPVWSIILHVLTTSLTQTVVRGMFAMRVWKLSNGNWLPAAAIALVSATELVCSIVITAKAFHITFSDLQKLDALVYVEFVSGFSGDCLVALCLCYLLHRSRTGFEKTESMINILMAYVINTGLLTAVVYCISLILFATEADNFIYVGVYFQLSKLYVNAYLAMLNARNAIRERTTDEVVSIHLSHLSQGRSGPSMPSAPHAARSYDKENRSLAIRVDTEVDLALDSPGTCKGRGGYGHSHAV